ncbi:MAG: DUF6647 family protein [Pseudorhodoplanes sp.]
MDLLIAALTAWIVAKTGLSAVEPPKIEFAAPVRMSEVAFGPKVAASPLLRALYSQPAGTVYLRKDWDAAKLRDQSELLHELVHRFQFVHNLPYACGAEREKLAYELQIAWLRENGIADPYEYLEINAFFVVMTSVCRDADHD